MDLSGKSYKAFLERQEALKKQYSPKQAEKQHSKGKLTARERISLLFDEGTFEEIDAFVTPANQPVEFGKVERTYGDGVIVGHGKVNGRLVFAFAQDFTIMGGSLGLCSCKKDSQDPGNGPEDGNSHNWNDGFRRSKNTGGVASLSGYACYFSQYNPFFRHYSPAMRYNGTCSRRSSILPCSHRLCISWLTTPAICS